VDYHGQRLMSKTIAEIRMRPRICFLFEETVEYTLDVKALMETSNQMMLDSSKQTLPMLYCPIQRFSIV
jgi:hypothetical protein